MTIDRAAIGKSFVSAIPLAALAIVALGVASYIYATGSSDKPTVIAVQGRGELIKAAGDASQDAGFAIPLLDERPLGLEAFYVSTLPAPGRDSRVDEGAGGTRVVIDYYEPQFDPGAPDAYSGLRMEVTYSDVESRVGRQEAEVDGTRIPIQSVEEVPFDVEGYTLTEVIDTVFGGGYTGYLVSGEGRSFQVLVFRQPKDDDADVPGRSDVMPLLRQLALSPAD